MLWWVLQDHGEQPYGVITLDDQSAVRRYVPDVGLVRDQGYADHVFLGEPGARMVGQDEALALIQNGSLAAVDDVDTSGDVLPVPENGAS